MILSEIMILSLGLRIRWLHLSLKTAVLWVWYWTTFDGKAVDLDILSVGWLVRFYGVSTALVI